MWTVIHFHAPVKFSPIEFALVGDVIEEPFFFFTKKMQGECVLYLKGKQHIFTYLKHSASVCYNPSWAVDITGASSWALQIHPSWPRFVESLIWVYGLYILGFVNREEKKPV